jgi:hypothetical protein
VAGSCEHVNESFSSISGGGFLSYLSNYQLCMKDSAPWSQLKMNICKRGQMCRELVMMSEVQ